MDLRPPESCLSSIALHAMSVIRAAAYIFKRAHKLTRPLRCAYCAGGFPQKEPHSFCIKSFGFKKMATAGLLGRRRSDQRTYIVWHFQALLKSRETPVSLCRARRLLPALGLLPSPAGRDRFQQHPQLCTGFLRESSRILLTPRKQGFILRSD